jgi:catechol 2,3-dioxygenase-like lactoylglutathione lyase family enzyme
MASGSLAFEIDHVQIAMPKGGEGEARRFFGELLGLAELPKPPDMATRGGCWFATSDRQIHLGVDADFRAAKKAHVALNTASLDELRARLERAGYETYDDSEVGGRKRFFTHDPFGNRIEFMDRAARI